MVTLFLEQFKAKQKPHIVLIHRKAPVVIVIIENKTL